MTEHAGGDTLTPATPYNARQLSLIRAEFDRCWHWLEPALAHAGGLYSRDTLLARIESGASHLWPTPNACGVVQILTFPRATVCELWLAGGSLAEIMAEDGRMVEWAKLNGATRMVMTGREGWEKVLKANGWQKSAIVLTRSI